MKIKNDIMKKSVISFILLLILSVLALSLIACGGPGQTEATVKFTYKDKDADSATVISTVVVNIGEKVAKPEDPFVVENGYKVVWFNGDEEWDFNESVKKDITLRAVKVAITYSITYELDGAESNGGNPYTYTVEDQIILNVAWNKPVSEETLAELKAHYAGIMEVQSADYAFIGWKHKDSTAAPASDLVIPIGSTGDIVLQACFADEPTCYGTGIDDFD